MAYVLVAGIALLVAVETYSHIQSSGRHGFLHIKQALALVNRGADCRRASVDSQETSVVCKTCTRSTNH
jgi:hypothetical protein